MADRAEPQSPESLAGRTTGGSESGGAEPDAAMERDTILGSGPVVGPGADQDVFDTHDMGIEAGDGLSAELSALVAKVSGGFNAPEASRPAPQTAAQSPAPLSHPADAQDIGPAGGGVQPTATPMSPDPGPPYEDEISASLAFSEIDPGLTDAASGTQANGEAEEASEWVFVEIEGDDDTAAPGIIEPPHPAASDDGFFAKPRDTEVDFVRSAGTAQVSAGENAAGQLAADADGGPTLASLTNETPRPPVEMSTAVPEPTAAIPLDIAVEASDAESDDVLTVEIQGLPEGSSLSAGREQLDGSWLLDAAELADLSVSPPAGWITDFEIEITATETDLDTGESSSVSDAMMVCVSGGAPAMPPEAPVREREMAPSASRPKPGPGSEPDSVVAPEPEMAPGPEARFGEIEDDQVAAPAAAEEMLEFVDKTGAAETGAAETRAAETGAAETRAAETESGDGGAIAFRLDAALVDTDGSERLTLLVTGLPDGATLTGGKRGPKGTWLLTPNDIDDLGIELLPGMADDLTIRVQVIATERGDPRVSTVLTDMIVWVENCGTYWRTTSVNARTDDGNVAFAPGEPGRITVLSEVGGWTGGGEDGEAACFLRLPSGYRVPWISPGLDADDRWSPGPDGTGGVLDLSDFITADGRLNWTFGVEAGMRAEPAASADFRISADNPPAPETQLADNITHISGGDGMAVGAGEESPRGGGGEDRLTGGPEETPPAGAGASSPDFPAPGNGHDQNEVAVTAELELSKGTVVDSDAGSVTLSADAVGAIRLRDGVLKIEGVRAIEW